MTAAMFRDPEVPPLILTAWSGTGPFKKEGQVARPLDVQGSILFNGVGQFAFAVDDDDERITALERDDCRITVDYRPDYSQPAIRLLSGPCGEITGSGVFGARQRAFAVGDDWSEVFNEIVGYPNPTGGPDQQGVDEAYFTVGPAAAETVLRGIVVPNLTRTGSDVIFPPSAGQGSPITVSIRMHQLAERLFPTVETPGGLMVQVLQTGTTNVEGDTREIIVTVPPTRSQVLYETSGVVDVSEWKVTKPLKTRFVIGAGGEGTARYFQEFVRADWETQFRLRREGFLDARDVEIADPNRATILQQRADEAFAENGPKYSLTATLLEDSGWEFAKAYNLGTGVTILPDGAAVPIVDRIRQIDFELADGGLVNITPKIGDWSDSASDLTAKIVARLQRAVSNQQRSL